MSGKDGKPGLFEQSYGLKNTDETREHYARWAESYDEEIGSEKGYQQPSRCASALLKVLDLSSAKVLDVGCGTGLSGIALQASGYGDIDGCDLSPEMLEKAETTGCYNRLFETNLNLPPIDADNESYNGVTAVGVFSFGHISASAIDELLRVLKPGGPLVIGLNDKYYNQGDFPAKLEQLESHGKIDIAAREHGAHMQNVEGSTGWVITSVKK